jgi:hypothetical protein
VLSLYRIPGEAKIMQMAIQGSKSVKAVSVLAAFLVTGALLSALAQDASAPSWPNYAHDPQHSAVSAVAAQPLNKTHWSTPVDLHPPSGEILIHYGSPLITAANTVIVPVKTGTDTFRIEAHDGGDGTLLWTQATNYHAPSAQFLPSFSPVLTHNRLYIPAAGGVIMVRENPDQPNGKVFRLAFYGIKNYDADPSTYNANVEINTPITADSEGNLYFGFLVLGSTPIALQSGLARISANGAGSFISAASVAADPQMTEVDMCSAPALSNDERTIYLGVNGPGAGYGYLASLNSQTLKPTAAVRLKDPSSGLDAWIFGGSSASPTVGPDGDVYFGVLENPFPNHNDRGWLLHFDSTLTLTKIPGSFGWDDTPSIVAASLVSSYHGTSSYLLMTKYNNYKNIGTGNGVNKIAILDPNATEQDPIISSVKVMREVITKKGLTPDPTLPAVREWCINSAVVDPITKSILANSEDGKLYRWDLTTNTFSEKITLSSGISEAYTPTVIGPDGTAYAINDAILFAAGK